MARAHEPARRGPQSAQSVHAVQVVYSEPEPPSSQSPSEAKRHVLMHVPPPGGAGGGGEGGCAGGDGGGYSTPGDGGVRGGLGSPAQLPGSRVPQSKQSLHAVQVVYSEPEPPSSQSPSEAKRHVFRQRPLPGGPGGGGAGKGGGGR